MVWKTTLSTHRIDFSARSLLFSLGAGLVCYEKSTTSFLTSSGKRWDGIALESAGKD